MEWINKIDSILRETFEFAKKKRISSAEAADIITRDILASN